MAPKVQYAVKVQGNAAAIQKQIEALQKLPPHRWIPFEELNSSNMKLATMTPRQSAWLTNRIAKQVEGSSVVFTPAPSAPTS